MTTFLDKLRIAAMNCSNLPYRFALHHAADEVAGRLHILAAELTEANAIAFNGAWANAARMLKDTPPEQPFDPNMGSGAIEELKKAA